MLISQEHITDRSTVKNELQWSPADTPFLNGEPKRAEIYPRHIEHNPLFWLFKIPDGANAPRCLELATEQFSRHYPRMIPWVIISPSLHGELGTSQNSAVIGDVVPGLNAGEFCFVLGIYR